jgi:oligopeptide transport system substrate-binding protein
MLLLLAIAACSMPKQEAADVVPTETAPPTTRPISADVRQPDQARVLPTATVAPTPEAQPGQYVHSDLGISFTFPEDWTAEPGDSETTLQWLTASTSAVYLVAYYSPLNPGDTLEQAAGKRFDVETQDLVDVETLSNAEAILDDGRKAWRNVFTAKRDDGSPLQIFMISAARFGRLVTLFAFGAPEDMEAEQPALETIGKSLRLDVPQRYGIPRDQALFYLGGESTNPRHYDPAHGGGDHLVFSGLVRFNPELDVVPDLAETWEISDDRTVYTFHLQPDARFHTGRPVTAQDLIYSWERAADPATDSDLVRTYLGDIVGVNAKRAGKAHEIAGLKALDNHTLQVTIDAPKPYFIMKLTYSVAAVVDRENVESGAEWYRTPNGTGPYRLIRWDRFTLKLYERNQDYHGTLPAIRYVGVELYSGVGIRLYETGQIDTTGIWWYDVSRVRDPLEPLHAELRETVTMCTSYVVFDVRRPPFDDPKVRQAFALAVDTQRYVDVTEYGVPVPARGLYPPALPGHDVNYKGVQFDPDLAHQRLAESTYGSADRLPPIVFTSSGHGATIDPTVGALLEMWRTTLGVTVEIENLDPNMYYDKIHDGEHGQILTNGWCADYPDPENFADILFHTDAEENFGGYSNPELDTLLEQARVEPDTDRRMSMYQQAEQIVVEDAAAIFLSHGLSFALVKPYVQGYTLTPIGVTIEPYLSIDRSKME